MAAWWNAKPCNVDHSSAPVGSRRFFDEVEARKYRVEPHLPAFADFAGWDGQRVLEIGTGMGGEAVNFAHAGAHVTAVDVSPTSLALARQRAEAGDVQVDFVEADAERLTEWVDGPFDLVWSFGAVHHTPHPERALAEARRLVAPDGELRLMVYHRASTKVAALVLRHPTVAWRGMDRAVAVQSEAQTGCPVTWTYTRRQARRLLEQTSWAVTEMRVAHIFPYAVGPYRQHRYVRRWYWRLMPRKVFAWLECHVGWHLLITARPA
ncbi:MAG: class I SAM-dependent methyltransferase [Pseudomonadota bacterium]